MATKFKNWMPAGVIPAALLPFDNEFAIDKRAFQQHLRDLLAVDGISAITTNAHSTEVHACTEDEQRRILDHTMEVAGDTLPVIFGVYADGSQNAAGLARMAAANGASSLLVFPSQVFSMGGHLRPEMVIAHFKTIADATDLPIIAFEYALAGPLGYSLETLLKLVEALPSVKAIKDWSNDPMQHERHVRVLQNLSPRVNVLSTHSAWLMSSLVAGCAGLLSGAGSVIAHLQVELFRAVQRNDLARARAVNDRIYPLAQAFYAPPFLDMHNRMKEALVMLGRLPRAVVRPPLLKLSDAEIERLRVALEQAGLFEDYRTGMHHDHKMQAAE
jgi:4-hydroxy-tetrahydrodipicolinate synthase